MNKLISASELAGGRGVGRATVYAWVRQGRLPALRLGRRGVLRFDPADLEPWLQSKRDDGGASARPASVTPAGGSDGLD